MLGGIFSKVPLKEAVAKSNIPTTCKTFEEVPQDTCPGTLVTALKREVMAGRLAKKVWKWFDERQGKEGDLQYCFNGQRVTVVLSHLCKIVDFFEAGRIQSKTMADCACPSLCWVKNGREAKHSSLQKLSANTTYQHRSAEIF